MLKYMPIYGSILLTIIIVWIVVSTIIGNRRKIGRSLAGAGPLSPAGDRSTCCNAYMKPQGWTADGWVATCRACGGWQYLGDDHDNPPSGFNRDGSPMLGYNANGGRASEDVFTLDLQADDRASPVLRKVADDSRTILEIFDEQTSRRPPAPRPSDASRPDGSTAVRPEVTSEEDGDPLPAAMTHQPNIGGEGNPDYQGPHYLVDHDRFVPYDVLRDPPEGAAVHIVGNVACVGPLEVETGDRGDADSIRDEEES